MSSLKKFSKNKIHVKSLEGLQKVFSLLNSVFFLAKPKSPPQAVRLCDGYRLLRRGAVQTGLDRRPGSNGFVWGVCLGGQSRKPMIGKPGTAGNRCFLSWQLESSIYKYILYIYICLLVISVSLEMKCSKKAGSFAESPYPLPIILLSSKHKMLSSTIFFDVAIGNWGSNQVPPLQHPKLVTS